MHWDLEPDLMDEQEVRATVEAALAHGGREGLAVDVIFVDDPTLAELHGRFLGDPTPTDVMAFELGEEGQGPAAEIYVSLDRARAVAQLRAGDARREAALYLVHGALHLCGYDDHEEPQRGAMRAAESQVLTRLGHALEHGPHELDEDDEDA